jgi:hypothetical protein
MKNHLPLLVLLVCFSSDGRADGALAAQFDQPPAAARPWAWWMWQDGHVNAAGIRQDIAAQADTGMGGHVIFNTQAGVPSGPVRYGSRPWFELMSLAGAEAQARGLSTMVHFVGGFSGIGGPWVKPEEAMQLLTWSETTITADAPQPLRLAQPPATEGFYRDIAVLAFPTPVGESAQPSAPPKVYTESAKLDLGAWVDGDPQTKANWPRNPADAVIFAFASPRTLAALRFQFAGIVVRGPTIVVEVADGGEGPWRELSRFEFALMGTPLRASGTIGFAPTRSAWWRLRILESPTPRREDLGLSEIAFLSASRVHEWELKAAHLRRWGHDGGLKPSPAGALSSAHDAHAISATAILDLSEKLDADGSLAWTPPPGPWTILRIGHTLNGRHVEPAPAEAVGWEPSTLRGAGVKPVFENSIDRLLAPAPEGAALAGKLRAVEFDSWELGAENWCTNLREEFRRRCGYDLLPWLVVSAGGRVVDSMARSEAFLWDMRRTLADLIADNFYSGLAGQARKRGLTFYAEASGAQQFLYDGIGYFRHAEVPMGEFWWGTSGPRADCKLAASAAQIHGRTLVSSEAFTSPGGWRESPAQMKALADAAFCSGVNHFIIHNSSSQPHAIGPGLTLGKWGVNHHRLNTWWEIGAPSFHAYLARTSALLQTGRSVADVLMLLDEGIPSALTKETGPFRFAVPGVLPPGYDFTATDVKTLRERFSVRPDDGALVLPTGEAYRLLVLPERSAMTPETLTLIAELARAGVKIIGPQPTHSPSLRGQPAANATVARAAGDLWNAGKIMTPQPLTDVLAKLQIAPDVAWVGVEPDALDYHHRRGDDGDVYFLANRTERTMEARVTFRTVLATPELWDPVTGSRHAVSDFEVRAGRTTLPVALAPHGSVFVVFPKMKSTGAALQSAKTWPQRAVATATARTLGGPWRVRFKPMNNFPEFERVMPELSSWAASADEEIKYFSGTATYTLTFEAPTDLVGSTAPVWLDLGEVQVVAEATLNGQKLGARWTPPWRFDIAKVLRPGENRLEVRVANLWVNRLIGDERLPADLEYDESGKLKVMPAWLTDGGARPSGRRSFSGWRHHRADSPLSPSGLLGPVKLGGN